MVTTTDSKETLAVKPLEWISVPKGKFQAYAAVTVLGATYSVIDSMWKLEGMTSVRRCANDDEAKAAAQADYERRIRSALVASAPVSPDADLMERMAAALKNLTGIYDTPIERRRKEGSEFYREAIDTARAALADYKARGEQHKTAD